MSSPELADVTLTLQQTISRACDEARKKLQSSEGAIYVSSTTVGLEKGDYAIQMISIPKNSKVTLLSKDRVRLLYVGKRNRPMFSLEENASLMLKEKLEIYYNTNNVQEVLRLMVRRVSPGGKSDFGMSEHVKVSLFSKKI